VRPDYTEAPRRNQIRTRRPRDMGPRPIPPQEIVIVASELTDRSGARVRRVFRYTPISCHTKLLSLVAHGSDWFALST
jgi:hypothetical protein